MRKQDLKRFDENMMVGILATFCGLFIVFFALYIYGLWSAEQVLGDVRVYLWTSYALIALIIGLVFFSTKKPHIAWVKPVAESDIMDSGKYKLERGKSYLIKEEHNEKSFDIFRDAVTHGVTGFCISRENPEEIRKKHGLGKTQLIWLTEADAPDALNPDDAENINYAIDKFLDSTKNGIIIFDGIDYLISFLKFHKVVHLFEDIKDKIAIRGHILIVPLNAGIVPLRKLRMLEREFSEIKSQQ